MLIGLDAIYLIEEETTLSKIKKGSSPKLPQAPKEVRSEEKEKIRQKELAAMIEKYEAVIKSGDAGSDVWAKLGELYTATSEYDKAVKYFDKALMLKPDEKEEISILTNLATTYAKGGVFEKEVECYNVLLRRVPAEPSIWGKAARAYERFGRIQEAVLYYTRAIRMNSTDPDLFYDYSFFCEKLGQLDNAVSAAKRVLELKPDSERALERASILYAKAKDYDKAMKLRLRMLELNPGDNTRWEDLVAIAIAKKEFDYAVKICHKGILRLNSPTLWYMLGDVYMEQNRENYALYCYNIAAGVGNQGAKNKADALISKNVTPRGISLHESALGAL